MIEGLAELVGLGVLHEPGVAGGCEWFKVSAGLFKKLSWELVSSRSVREQLNGKEPVGWGQYLRTGDYDGSSEQRPRRGVGAKRCALR